MSELRRAVMLCHVLPGMGLRVWSGDRLVAVVAGPGRDLLGGGSSDATKMTACAARSVVAEAWQGDAADRRSLVLGLATLGEPCIEEVLQPFCLRHPGGVYRVICAQTWVYAFVTTLGLAAVATAVECAHLAVHPASDASTLARRVDFHHDVDLGVTVLWVEIDEDSPWRQEPAVLAMLHRLVATSAAQEIDDDLAELLTQDGPLSP